MQLALTGRHNKPLKNNADLHSWMTVLKEQGFELTVGDQKPAKSASHVYFVWTAKYF